MPRKDWTEGQLFDPGPAKMADKSKTSKERIWTQNKARLISRYIYYFQLVTKHGTYIDGFAGPQDSTKLDAWAAALVLDLEPLWLRHFFLCDQDISKLGHLKDLALAHPKLDIQILPGDFNLVVHSLLQPENIGEKEATFCLLDQRTFECEWATVKALARFKADSKNKIEIFYFLAEWWIYQAFGGIKSVAGEQRVEAWWGRPDWRDLPSLSGTDRAQLMADRFTGELGYGYAKPYAIYEKSEGEGRVAYYMIHASDHYRAPALMSAAYGDAVMPPKPVHQAAFDLGLDLEG
ncbi:MAG: three-Cys-motif partner protein TcmP [Actinobacteria bacterium]|nr:three-Cys-motif partner protein TcmP [Actinomycetota bacterium]